MKINKLRPEFSRKERYGLGLVIALSFTEYAICIAILSGSMDSSFIYKLDLTGQWVIGAERWVNASITYRDLMVPVYISANIFMLLVFLVTLATRDWANVVEWGKRISFIRLIGGCLLVTFLYLYAVAWSGAADFIYDASDLQRLERSIFLNKNMFYMMLLFFGLSGYYAAEYLTVFFAKAKKIKPVFVLNTLFKKSYSIKKCSKCNGEMKCIEKKHYRIIDIFGFLILAAIAFFIMLTILTIIGILSEWYGIPLMVISMYLATNYLLWKIVGYDVVTYCKCQSCGHCPPHSA